MRTVAATVILLAAGVAPVLVLSPSPAADAAADMVKGGAWWSVTASKTPFASS